jgi:hypothetical protein
MSDRPKFELEDPAPEKHKTQAMPEAQPAAAEPPREPTVTGPEEQGLQLSIGLEEGGYHPVILFGNRASGKTSLLLSLISLLRTETDLHCGLRLGEPILSTGSTYGKEINREAEAFWGKKTQDFINGKASPRTTLEAPFFVPLVLSPEGKTELRFAFMESNGEWYQPDRGSERLFKPLPKQIETFIVTFQGPITFLHLLPYTQSPVYSTDVDRVGDAMEIEDASIAIKGALDQYRKIRPNTQDDRHLMLVTKWDAHAPDKVPKIEILVNPGRDPEDFAANRYAQAVAAFQSLPLRADQRQFSAYCSGLIAGNKLNMPKRGEPLRDAILSYPENLWTWLYRTSLIQLGEHAAEPFPAPPQPNWFVRLLNQIF